MHMRSAIILMQFAAIRLSPSAKAHQLAVQKTACWGTTASSTYEHKYWSMHAHICDAGAASATSLSNCNKPAASQQLSERLFVSVFGGVCTAAVTMN
jgi:hypothetical protein